MSRLRRGVGAGLAWVGLMSGCEPADAPELTRALRTAERAGAPPAAQAELPTDREADDLPAAPQERAPPASTAGDARDPDSPSAAGGDASVTAVSGASQQPEAPEVPALPTTPSTSALRLRATLRVSLALPLGIELGLRLSALLEDGSVRVLGETRLNATGGFQLALAEPPASRLLLFELLDTQATARAALLRAGPITSDEPLQLPALDAERALESDVLRAAAGCANERERRPSTMTLALDVRTWIDPTLSSALTAAVARGASRELAVAGLARASVAAALARAEVLAQGGLGALQAELTAAQELALTALDAAPNGAEAPSIDPRRSLDRVLRQAGARDAALRTRAHVAASLVFSATLARAFGPDSGLSGALFPALHAAARLEAEAGGDNVLELLSIARASAATLAEAAAAAEQFRADVEAAGDVRQLAAARVRFVEALFARAQASSGGLLGGVLELGGGLLSGILATVQQLTAQLDAALALDLSSLAESESCSAPDAATRLDAALSRLSRTLANFSAEVRRASLSSARAGSEREAELLAGALSSAQLLLRQRD